MSTSSRSEPGTAISLGAVVASLLASPEWQTEERSSSSIVQTPALRVVVTALHAGATMHNDDPDEAVTLQVIRGQVVVSVDHDGSLLEEGSLLGLGSGVPWRLRASEDSVVLVTVAPR